MAIFPVGGSQEPLAHSCVFPHVLQQIKKKKNSSKNNAANQEVNFAIYIIRNLTFLWLFSIKT